MQLLQFIMLSQVVRLNVFYFIGFTYLKKSAFWKLSLDLL